MADERSRRMVGVVLFEGFELLDVFGPLEMFGVLADRFEIQTVAAAPGPVASAQGPRAVADHGWGNAPPPDITLVPGGIGNRALIADPSFLEWLVDWSRDAEYVTSVCTGSAVLATAGLLDGYRATSNKMLFGWASTLGTSVEWVPEARWVADRDRWTSSGVAAGMDMTLALIAHLHGDDVATAVADGVEHDWHRDPGWDPFAAKYGLVPD